jgi:MoaA/NifB/PqqE/SkfB family radical SAM enzyme
MGTGQATFRCVRAGVKFFWDVNVPGWPSKAFSRIVEQDLNRTVRFRKDLATVHMVMLSVTNRCPLSCEHCYDWKCSAGPDGLPLPVLEQLVHGLQSHGVSQIRLGGGEPLVRFDDILELIRSAGPGTDFWLMTSGWGLTEGRAKELRSAGLTGIFLSLDHWDPAAHDRFRGRAGSYAWVERAARNANNSGLVVCLSLCATRQFVSERNLEAYAEVATELGAEFIQILDVRASGRYTGKNVGLSDEQVTILERFHNTMNVNPSARGLPIVSYPDLYQRRRGCMGSGDRYLYIDGQGIVHPCTFRRMPLADAIHDDLKEVLRLHHPKCNRCFGKTPEVADFNTQNRRV